MKCVCDILVLLTETNRFWSRLLDAAGMHFGMACDYAACLWSRVRRKRHVVRCSILAKQKKSKSESWWSLTRLTVSLFSEEACCSSIEFHVAHVRLQRLHQELSKQESSSRNGGASRMMGRDLWEFDDRREESLEIGIHQKHLTYISHHIEGSFLAPTYVTHVSVSVLCDGFFKFTVTTDDRQQFLSFLLASYTTMTWSIWMMQVHYSHWYQRYHGSLLSPSQLRSRDVELLRLS
jgi:hypothetical protein